MSGLVEDGVIVAKLPWLRIGAIALPDPLFCGPTLATTLGLETSLRALVAACVGVDLSGGGSPVVEHDHVDFVAGNAAFGIGVVDRDHRALLHQGRLFCIRSSQRN